MTYGLPTQRRRDPFAQFAEETIAEITGAASPGKYFVNVIKPLKHLPEWMPGVGFKQEAKEIRKRIDRLVDEPYEVRLSLYVSLKSITAGRNGTFIICEGCP